LTLSSSSGEKLASLLSIRSLRDACDRAIAELVAHSSELCGFKMTRDEEAMQGHTRSDAAVEAQRAVLAAAQRQRLKRALETLEIVKVLVSSGASKGGYPGVPDDDRA
jgi:hypothetical protein